MVATTGITFISAMQITRSMSPPWLEMASITGALGVCPVRVSSAKAGVSSTSRRMMRPAISTTALRRNGTRQPQFMNTSVGSR